MYCIWVGFGLFFIELYDEIGEWFWVEGGEFGVIIGCFWCCGWIDLF